jgi:hypothetical protein
MAGDSNIPMVTGSMNQKAGSTPAKPSQIRMSAKRGLLSLCKIANTDNMPDKVAKMKMARSHNKSGEAENPNPAVSSGKKNSTI